MSVFEKFHFAHFECSKRVFFIREKWGCIKYIMNRTLQKHFNCEYHLGLFTGFMQIYPQETYANKFIKHCFL